MARSNAFKVLARAIDTGELDNPAAMYWKERACKAERRVAVLEGLLDSSRKREMVVR